jgi:2-keto-3-deoxy-6-phosphogluconate aldolase
MVLLRLLWGGSHSLGSLRTKWVSRGGIPIVELTTTVPKANELIAHLVKKHPHMVVGARTVLDLETARACLAAVKAGADFVKIFPCSQLGRVDYLHALKAPFP